MADHVPNVIVYFGHDDVGHYVMREGSDVREYVPVATWRMYVEAGTWPKPQKNGEILRLSITERVRVDIYNDDLDEIPEVPEQHPQYVRSVLLTPDTTKVGL